jgi:pimeloyl-ACP methyl ester carboxylesterase
VHEALYQTADLGSLGAVFEHGNGPIDMVLISGFGLGASVFEGFMERNASRYHMLAITLPGFEGTAAPPMPRDGTSYGMQSWTRAAIEGVVRLIYDRGLKKPVLVGHFINGTQVAARVAIDHPDLARALVLLAGTPRFEPVEPMPSWPKGLTLDQKVAAVDGYMAPHWFKTVTRKTWVAGNFVATDYSAEESRGRTFADRANEPPLPVLIRYLCEFHASDVKLDFGQLEQPLLMIQPSFTAAARADKARDYLRSFFAEPWQGTLTDRLRTEVKVCGRSGHLADG